MNFLHFFVFFITTICYNILHCNTATVESIETTRKSMGTSSTKYDETQTPGLQILWKNILFPKQSSSKTEELNKIENLNMNSPIRKSKILSSLAFLAGLSVGGLTGASSSVNTYAKPAPVTLNFDGSRVSPQIASIYGSYPYMPHPYIFATPFGLYSVLSPLGLHTAPGFQNDLQVLNSIGTKKPTDLSNNDEYVEEAKKVEDVKPSNTVPEETTESSSSYDKAANLYSDDRYNYYVNPSLDSSVPNEFSREQIPEYFPYDFNRYLYTSYNTPPLENSGFRPVA